jgi:hypothetical protein
MLKMLLNILLGILYNFVWGKYYLRVIKNAEIGLASGLENPVNISKYFFFS